MFRNSRLYLAVVAASVFAVSVLAGCATPAGIDVVPQLTAQLKAARATVDLIAPSLHVSPARVAAVRLEIDSALSVLATLGSIASLADPQLKPALDALNDLNDAVSAANAPAAAASSPAS